MGLLLVKTFVHLIREVVGHLHIGTQGWLLPGLQYGHLVLSAVRKLVCSETCIKLSLFGNGSLTAL